MQTANFLITGVLLLAFAVGLRPALRRYGYGIWVPLLIGLLAVGLIGAGLFPTDPISGYPPGTPMVPAGTAHGTLHDTFSAFVFAALPAACFVMTYWFTTSGRTGWAAFSAGTAIVFLTGFVVAGMGFSQHPLLMPIGGLLQRLTIIIGWAWLATLAVHLLNRGPFSMRSTWISWRLLWHHVSRREHVALHAPALGVPRRHCRGGHQLTAPGDDEHGTANSLIVDGWQEVGLVVER